MDIIKGFGFIDLLFIILWLTISYTAISKGLFLEILKLTALVVSALIAFQFYPFFTSTVTARVAVLSKDYFDVITFCVLFSIVGIILGLLTKLLGALFKREEVHLPEKLVALVFGSARAIFLTSIFIFLFYLFPAGADTPHKGLAFGIFKNIAPKVYLVSADILDGFIPGLTINMQVKKIYESR